MTTLNTTRTIICIVLTLLTVSTHALVNGEAPAEDDTRFDAVAAFSKTNWLIDNPQDKHVHNWFGGAVLIAPDVVLFARHLLPAKHRDNIRPNAYMVRFRRHVDGSLGSKKAGPQSYHQVPIAKIIPAKQSDLALGILAKPVEHIKPVKVYLEEQALEEQPAVLAGWGSESNWRGQSGPRKGLRVGKNTVAIFGRSVRILSYKTEARESKQGKRGSYVIDENAVPNMHDSGGSIFVIDENDGVVLCGLISSYTSGPYLAAANTDDFPIKAATQGGRALIDAMNAQKKKDSAE